MLQWPTIGRPVNFERVVQEIEDKKAKSGTILAELQAGYTIHDRILREAMVIVAR